MKKNIAGFFTLLLFTCLVFSGCDNFLSGADLVDDLNNAIERSRATSCTISVFSENNTFDFLGGKEKQLIKGESVQFNSVLDYENYNYAGFEVVALDNQAQNLNDYVKVDIASTDEEKKQGSYKFDVTLLKAYPSILIKLKSTLIPKVTNQEPEFDQLGVSCYRPIIITFNQKMYAGTLNNTFENLSIVDSENKDFTAYYNKPTLSDDGKTLTVIPKYADIEKLVKENRYVEFTVKLSGNVYTAKEDGSKSEYKLQEDFEWNVRFVDIQDTVKPELMKLSIYNNEEKEKEFTQTKATEWDETKGTEFSQNATKGKIYITAVGVDKESGIKSLCVKETLLNYADGSSCNTSINGVCEKAIFIEKEKSSFEADIFSYDLKTAQDGLIQLDFYVTDYGDTPSTVLTYYVVRHTTEIISKNNFVIYTNFIAQNHVIANICIKPEEVKTIVYCDANEGTSYAFDKLTCYDKIYKNIYSPVEISLFYKEGRKEGRKENLNT